MKKNEFLDALRRRIAALPAEDIERSLDYYSEIIDDCMEDGMTEDEAVEQVGSVEQAAANILDEMPAGSLVSAPQEERRIAPSYMSESFDSIRIEDTESDVLFIPSADGCCDIEWSEKLPHTVTVENGVLTVRRQTERKWFQRISLHGEQAKLFVRIPAGEYNDLFVSTASGDVRIPAEFAFRTAEVTSASGDVEMFANVGRKLRAKSVSGDVKVNKLTAGGMELSSVSGDVECAFVRVGGGLTIKTVSGDIELNTANCASLGAKTVSGDAKLCDAVAEELNASSISGDVSLTSVIISAGMNIQTTSGEVRLTGSDGGEINIKTSSGSVHGTLLSGKMFHCTSRSGSVNTPAPTPGGICRVSSGSGSIKLKVE